MSNYTSCTKRLLSVTYLRYSKETGKCVYPVVFKFYSNSTKPRNLNDIAARHARKNGIGWHHLIVKDAFGNTLSQRYRMYYQCLIK